MAQCGHRPLPPPIESCVCGWALGWGCPQLCASPEVKVSLLVELCHGKEGLAHLSCCAAQQSGVQNVITVLELSGICRKLLLSVKTLTIYFASALS